MGAKNQYSSIIFFRRIYRRYIDRKFLWAISTLLFLVAGESQSSTSRLLNNFWNFPRCAKCKSPLHGPRNYVDRTWQLWANYSVRTIPCYRAKPKLPSSNYCMKALSHWPEMKNSGRCAPWNFTKKYCTYTCHTLRVYSPPKVNSTPTIVSNIFANSQTIFRFCFFSKKTNPHMYSLQQSS